MSLSVLSRRTLAAIALLVAAAPLFAASPSAASPAVDPAQARAIARDAYVFGFPLVDSYRVQHTYFVDRANPEYKAPWNTVKNVPRVYTPEDRAIQTPNSDTPYSFVGLDLRAGPVVLTVPAIEPARYFSVQLIDAYTHNFAYVGSRTTGNGAGRFLIAGPGWKGAAPKGITKVIRAETAFAFALVRTQLFDPKDLRNVERIQAGYSVKPLTGTPPAAPIAFPAPLTAEGQRTDPRFFELMNFVLSQQAPHPADAAQLARFAKIGVGPGRRFEASRLPPATRAAIEAGMADAWRDMARYKAQRVDTGQVVSGDIFGTREFLGGDPMKRMTAAVLGIYGNSREEAMYPVYYVDATGRKLDGATGRYVLRFPKGGLPPVDAFWSLTLYEQPSALLSANRLNRYLVNSPMLPSLKRDPDGGLTLIVQHESPGAELESNWLPAPAGPFNMVLRLYRPGAAAVDGRWTAPKAEPVLAGTRPAPVAQLSPATAAAGGAAAVAQGGSAAAPVAPPAPGTVPVTPDTYIRAETDRSFGNYVGLAGGVNRFYHYRAPIPLDRQSIVRMNKDTLYSSAVVDTEGGASVTIPEPDAGRYMSILVIDNDHYAPAVFYKPGRHALPTDTKYVMIVVRTQMLRPDDPADLARANALQDRVVLETARSDPFPASRWEPASLKALTERYERESAALPSWKGAMGPRGKIDETNRKAAAAAAWGLFPEEHATYLNYSGGHSADVCHAATYAVPPNDAFWSITVYGADGFMKHSNAIVNSTNVKRNADGTFTVRYGSKAVCGDLPNRLDVADGWNFLMRVYRPGPAVLDGAYRLPKAAPVRSNSAGGDDGRGLARGPARA